MAMLREEENVSTVAYTHTHTHTLSHILSLSLYTYIHMPIPWMGEPGALQSVGFQKSRTQLSNYTTTHTLKDLLLKRSSIST